MAHREQVYAGPERRAGFERRTVAPREQVTGPRLVQTVAIGGVLFRPGQEKLFHEAVSRANAAASAAGQPAAIDLALLESRGAIRGFGAAAPAAPGAFTRSEQMDPRTFDRVAPAHDNATVIPGGVPLEVHHPLATPVGQAPAPAVATSVSSKPVPTPHGRATARTGGAGRPATGGRGATGDERATVARAAKKSTPKGTAA